MSDSQHGASHKTRHGMQHETPHVSPHGASWLRLARDASQTWMHAVSAHGLNPGAIRGRAATEEAGFVLLPLEIVTRQRQGWRACGLLFALGQQRLISVEPPEPLGAFDAVAREHAPHLRHVPPDPVRAPEFSSPCLILLALLEALNDDVRATVADIAARLDARSETVALVSGGFETRGQQPGVADIADTAIALGEAEELIAKIVEGQSMLARACRWLRRMHTAVDGTTGDDFASRRLPLLLADIHSLRRYACFQHDKIRNLQQSLMTTLDLKQNQVIKVFTVVTAVFTPPTLIAAFYGQNFAYMPELEIPWGEWLMIAMTGVFALLPLAYVKRKGWMR